VAFEVALGEVVILELRISEIDQPLDARVGSQVPRYGPRVRFVALEPDGQGLEALEEEEGAERGKRRPAVAQADRATSHGIGGLGETARRRRRRGRPVPAG